MPPERAEPVGAAQGNAPLERLTVTVGQYSCAGAKLANQDFYGCILPDGDLLIYKGMAFVVADGISTSRRGREAAETAVAGFLTDYYATPDAWSPQTSAQRVIAAINSWMHGQNAALGGMAAGYADSDRAREAEGLITTFTALILRDAAAHILHLGDGVAARVNAGGLERLTEAHRVPAGGGTHLLARALGMGRHVEIDHSRIFVQPGDILLLATDGLGDGLTDREIAQIVHANPDMSAAARQMCEAALAAGAEDNLTVQLVQVDSVRQGAADDLLAAEARLPDPPEWQAGLDCDGYTLLRPLHIGGRSHVWLARDNSTGAAAAIKRLSAERAGDPQARSELLLEEWALGRVRSPHVLSVPPRARPRRFLYAVSGYCNGITLEQWQRDHPRADIAAVRAIITQVARGLYALHRRQIIHRDLRPANVMIDANGTANIIDLGSARIDGMTEHAPRAGEDAFAGTLQFSAPELYRGLPASEQSDLYSLAAMAYFLLTGHLPYGPRAGAADTLSRQRRLRYVPVATYRDDVPDWADAAIAHALHVEPHLRYQHVSAFVHDLSVPNTALTHPQPAPLLIRNPVVLWQVVSAVLAAALMIALIR